LDTILRRLLLFSAAELFRCDLPYGGIAHRIE
jgi:hypothetical protein